MLLLLTLLVLLWALLRRLLLRAETMLDLVEARLLVLVEKANLTGARVSTAVQSGEFIDAIQRV